MIDTRRVAQEIVEGLKNELTNYEKDLQRDIYSICISGSFVRGDFIQCNSDLDVNIVFSPNFDGNLQNNCNIDHIVSIIKKARNNGPFPSHSAQGVEINFILWDWLPKSQKEIKHPTDGSYFTPLGIFLFDYHKNLDICWGNDPRVFLPKPLHPKTMAKLWFETILKKIENSTNIEAIAFATFKSIQLAQIVFGELTLDKNYLASQYENIMPPFTLKDKTYQIVSEYLNAIYPENRPKYFTKQTYYDIVCQLYGLVGKTE